MVLHIIHADILLIARIRNSQNIRAYYNLCKEQSSESLNEESLNTNDLSSNRKRKDKRASETVRREKARRWFDVEVDW